MKNKSINILTKIGSAPWLVMPHWMNAIINIASRKDALEGIPDGYVKEQIAARKEALSHKGGNSHRRENFIEKRGDVGVLHITGPIIRYANDMQVSGTVRSLQAYMEDFKALEDDKEVKTIVLNIDSPGGEASGVPEFAAYIRRSKKRVVAYVDDLAASAGYWIAAGADEIVSSETGMVGSIGVVFSILDASKYYKKNGFESIEIVSSVSPRKRPDPKTEEGKGQIQVWADKLGQKFVSAIAEFRGVTEDDVLQKFGGGDILIAEDAIKMGMIDKIGDFESLMTELDGGAKQTANPQVTKNLRGDTTMTAEELQKEHPETYSEIFSAGATAERERIKAIELAVPKSYGEIDIVAQLKFDGKSGATEVQAALFAYEMKQKEKTKTNLETDGEELAAQVEGIGGEAPEANADDAKEEKLAKARAAAIEKLNKKRGV